MPCLGSQLKCRTPLIMPSVLPLGSSSSIPTQSSSNPATCPLHRIVPAPSSGRVLTPTRFPTSKSNPESFFCSPVGALPPSRENTLYGSAMLEAVNDALWSAVVQCVNAIHAHSGHQQSTAETYKKPKRKTVHMKKCCSAFFCYFCRSKRLESKLRGERPRRAKGCPREMRCSWRKNSMRSQSTETRSKEPWKNRAAIWRMPGIRSLAALATALRHVRHALIAWALPASASDGC